MPGMPGMPGMRKSVRIGIVHKRQCHEHSLLQRAESGTSPIDVLRVGPQRHGPPRCAAIATLANFFWPEGLCIPLRRRNGRLQEHSGVGRCRFHPPRRRRHNQRS